MPFKTGNTEGSSGRPPLPEIVKNIRAADLTIITQTISIVLNMPLGTAIDVINRIKDIQKKGDYNELDKLGLTVWDFKVLQFAISGSEKEMKLLLEQAYGRPRMRKKDAGEGHALEKLIQERMGDPKKAITAGYKSLGIKEK